MKLIAFRIKNFRSIVDTDWCNLSEDNITGLIGQNESGKTAILEALYSFDSENISEDDLRSGSELPEVSCSFSLDETEFNEIFKDRFFPKNLIKKIKSKKYRVNLTRVWETKDSNKLVLEDRELVSFFEYDQNQKETIAQENSTQDEPQQETSQAKQIIITEEEFIKRIYEATPEFVLFEDFGSLLPNTISLENLQSNNEEIEGYWGAKNFMTIAKLDATKMIGSLRDTKTKIEDTNDLITKGFQEFWRQKIGKGKKIKVEFSLEHYEQSLGDKAGKPYLAFWISDGKDKLYPKQRSRGMRWFLSFYLQLRAGTEEENNTGTIYLIDEPGGSLHVRAQEDVLKVFDSLKGKLQVIYTTHSPFLIKPETIYRLLAVQRKDLENDRSETKVFNPHQLGSASADTLSPLYTSMGADFSSQQVIRKKNNVILEEISAYYYFSAFKKLINFKKEVFFLPATGTSNIPQLSYLFLGWGLNFIVVVDDDSSGRQIYNELKRNLFQDDEQKAEKQLIKIRGCRGIEDIFEEADFKKFVLQDESVSYLSPNSDYMKRSGQSKPVTALKFMLRVKNGKVKLRDFTNETQNKIQEITNLIESKLN